MVMVMVFNATFNNISVISWRSVLLVGKTGVPRENQIPVTSHWQTLSHDNGISSTPRLSGIIIHNVSGNRVIGTGYIGNCKSNYHTITTMTVPVNEMYDYKNINIPKLSHLLYNMLTTRTWCKVWQ